MWRFMLLPLLGKEETYILLFNWALQPEICQAFRAFEILRYRVNWVFEKRSSYLQLSDYELIPFKYGTAKVLDFQQVLWLREPVSGLGTWSSECENQ